MSPWAESLDGLMVPGGLPSAYRQRCASKARCTRRMMLREASRASGVLSVTNAPRQQSKLGEKHALLCQDMYASKPCLAVCVSWLHPCRMQPVG